MEPLWRLLVGTSSAVAVINRALEFPSCGNDEGRQPRGRGAIGVHGGRAQDEMTLKSKCSTIANAFLRSGNG
jgi:hypothetical protein